MKKFFLLLFFVFLSLNCFGGGYFSLYLIDRYYDDLTNDNSFGRVASTVKLWQNLGNFTFDLVIVNYYIPRMSEYQTIYPERSVFSFLGRYEIGDLYFEIGNNLVGGVENYDEIKFSVFYYYYILIFSLLPSLDVKYDFRGISGNISLLSSFSVSLSPIVNIDLPISLKFVSKGYRNVDYSGVVGLSLGAKVIVYWKSFDFGLESGYFISFSDHHQNYPYICLVLGISLRDLVEE